MTVDADLWLQAARAANDGEAITWFTNIHRSQKQAHEVCTSKLRRLNNLAHQWEHHLSLYDKLAVQHAHRALDFQRHAQVTETTLHPVRKLRAMCTKTPTAKQDYHLLVTNLLKEHMEPFFNRGASSNWTMTQQKHTDKRQPSTRMHPDKHDRPYTSPGSGHGSSGNPPCGKVPL